MDRHYLATFRGPQNQFVSYAIFRASNQDVAFRQAQLLGVGVQRALEKDIDHIMVDELEVEWLLSLGELLRPLQDGQKGGGA